MSLKKQEVVNILKKSAKAYASWSLFVRTDKLGRKIEHLVYKHKVLSSKEAMEYFGGSKVWDDTTWIKYLQANHAKYKTLDSFYLNDPKGNTLKSALRRNSVKGLTLKFVRETYWSSAYKKFSKKQWKKYLDLNSHKYNSLSQFIKHDELGGSLDRCLYRSKRISLKWVEENYWTETKMSLDELKKVHPAFDKIIKGKNVKIEKEVWLSNSSRVDRVLTNKQGKKILVELKSDLASQSFKHVGKQKSRYHRSARRKYKNLYLKTYVVSPKGNFGLSFKEFLKDVERFLK